MSVNNIEAIAEIFRQGKESGRRELINHLLTNTYLQPKHPPDCPEEPGDHIINAILHGLHFAAYSGHIKPSEQYYETIGMGRHLQMKMRDLISTNRAAVAFRAALVAELIRMLSGWLEEEEKDESE